MFIKNYGNHLGFTDEEYKSLGVKISDNDNEILKTADIVVQLNLLTNDNLLNLKENQILIGVLNPYKNQEKINELNKKNIKSFSLELLPRITRAQSMDVFIFTSLI